MRQAIEWQQYKAGGYVVAVPAAYTSCECPSCTCTDKRNRPRQALFRCISCGYENNADIVGHDQREEEGPDRIRAHTIKAHAREVSAGAVVPFARKLRLPTARNQPLGVAQATPKESSDFNQGRTSIRLSLFSSPLCKRSLFWHNCRRSSGFLSVYRDLRVDQT